MRSLWVQGYTDLDLFTISNISAFPVGTGIYRQIWQINMVVLCVPCGYRDIPAIPMYRPTLIRRSLWVQGYTAFWTHPILCSIAFPVGTGIYRIKVKYFREGISVPCGYRDIPRINYLSVGNVLRSLWVQGYTDNWPNAWWRMRAFPVGTGIYRWESSLGMVSPRVPCGYRDIPSTCLNGLWFK